MKIRSLILSLLIMAITLIAGCGQSGPLYLPNAKPHHPPATTDF